MFDVNYIMPFDDRDVLAFDPKMGLVVACYVEGKGWCHGYEQLYHMAGYKNHKFEPTHWYYLGVTRPDER